jgi:hypothetical protein
MKGGNFISILLRFGRISIIDAFVFSNCAHHSAYRPFRVLLQSVARTSSTSTTRVNTPAFRASAGRNGEPVPAVRNAAISTNLQAGTRSARRVDLAAIALWSAASTCTKSRFKTKRRSVSNDVTYLRPGTCCWKYLNRSSRPDTGGRKGLGPLSPALSEVGIESQPAIPFGRRKA